MYSVHKTKRGHKRIVDETYTEQRRTADGIIGTWTKHRLIQLELVHTGGKILK